MEFHNPTSDSTTEMQMQRPGFILTWMHFTKVKWSLWFVAIKNKSIAPWNESMQTRCKFGNINQTRIDFCATTEECFLAALSLYLYFNNSSFVDIYICITSVDHNDKKTYFITYNFIYNFFPKIHMQILLLTHSAYQLL